MTFGEHTSHLSAAKIEKMNIKKTVLLFIPFAVLFLITNVIFPLFKNPGTNV